MEKLNSFLTIIGLLAFLKESYRFLKDKSNAQKVQSFFYHKNSLKVLAAYLVFLGLLVLYINFLIYNIILLSFGVSIFGTIAGILVLAFLIIIEGLVLNKFYQFHKNEVDKYTVSLAK